MPFLPASALTNRIQTSLPAPDPFNLPLYFSLPCEGILVRRLGARFTQRNDIPAHEILQVLVQRLHAYILACLDGGIHLCNLVLADEVTDSRRAYHDFMRRHAALLILGLAQCLRNNRPQGFR